MKKLFLAFALLLSTLVSAQPLDKIVVFGDSLSDNGNFYHYMKEQFPIEPYYEGRFTDGLVWVELLAKSKSAELLDYAYGGAGVTDFDETNGPLFNLHQEISSFLIANDNKADENSLYVVWIGANNYLGLPKDLDGVVNKVLNGITYDIRLLAESGAKHFLVANLPDLGLTPAASDYDEPEELTYMSNEHNRRLQESVESIKELYPDVEFHFLDVNKIFKDILDTPEQFGFSSKTTQETCYDKFGEVEGVKPSMLSIAAAISGKQGEPYPCDGYLFFDFIHPTAQAHRLMSEIASDFLIQEGVEFVEGSFEKTA